MVATLPDVGSGQSTGGVRRPPARWFVLGAVLLLVIGGYFAAPHLVWLTAGAPPSFSAGAVVTVPSYGERGTHILAYEYGKEFTVRVPIRNSGIVPMTVTDVALTEQPRPLAETVAVTVAGERLPLTLWPGDTMRVELRVRFGNCRYYHEREMQNMSGAVVTGHVLGASAVATARFGHDLVAHSPMIIGCPDRTLVRGDDLRR